MGLRELFRVNEIDKRFRHLDWYYRQVRQLQPDIGTDTKEEEACNA